MSLSYLCKNDREVSYCKYTQNCFFLPSPLIFHIAALYPMLSNHLLIYFTFADTGCFLMWTLISWSLGFLWCWDFGCYLLPLADAKCPAFCFLDYICLQFVFLNLWSGLGQPISFIDFLLSKHFYRLCHVSSHFFDNLCLFLCR